ncbi:hypothetical protein [Actinosynnema sp. NPDC020468]|uniref:hypothetical protein n=1 Tax=Actinosynnema sp. NPDC020468 TaxID=3154488 RepID=UPI003400381E
MPRRVPALVLALCAVLVPAGCAGADLKKQPPQARSTIPANAENVTRSSGPTPTDVPSGEAVDPAFAVEKLRLIDPCKLFDHDVLAKLGKPANEDGGGFSRCSNFMKDKNGKDLAITVEVGQTLTSEVRNADKQLAGLKSYEQTLEGSACFVSVITQEKPPLGITVQIGYKEGDACAPGRTVAESVVKAVKARTGAFTPAKGSLVTLDPCTLPDSAAVSAAAGASARVYPYGLHNCSWVGDGEEMTVDLRQTFVPKNDKFDDKQTDVDLGGTKAYQLDNPGAYPSCSVRWVQRRLADDDAEIVEVKSAGPKKSEFDRCARAVAFSKVLVAKIPKG